MTKEHSQSVQIKAEKCRNGGAISSFFNAELDALAKRTVTYLKNDSNVDNKSLKPAALCEILALRRAAEHVEGIPGKISRAVKK